MNYYEKTKMKEKVYQNILQNDYGNIIENILNIKYGKHVCSCPKCKSNILEHQSNYVCEYCGMKIQKEICGKYINNKMVKELCSKGHISVRKNHLKYEIYFNDKFNLILRIHKI
ncbi:hypothetical protein [Anaerofustis butyriciformans]|uniref:hypothetical protein n=1 Tax=Anaerofustis butyriciformans TaxID=3108533 RepID=UPI002E37D0AA|nr:hypothetical protein [Anaerofustis sp. HA2171]